MSENLAKPESKERPVRATVISGFPGIGKSTLFRAEKGGAVLDSDSTDFSRKDASKNDRNPDWPKNYIEHIASSAEKSDVILVSTHKETRDALTAAGIPFTLVYPSLDMKEEYIQRYIDRSSDPAFIETLKNNYDSWIKELMAQEDCKHVVLTSGQYLSDVIEQIKA